MANKRYLRRYQSCAIPVFIAALPCSACAEIELSSSLRNNIAVQACLVSHNIKPIRTSGEVTLTPNSLWTFRPHSSPREKYLFIADDQLSEALALEVVRALEMIPQSSVDFHVEFSGFIGKATRRCGKGNDGVLIVEKVFTFKQGH